MNINAKKTLLACLGVLILLVTTNISYSKTVTNSQVANAIRLYKNGNYTECYDKLTKYVKKDPSNVLAQYYLAMSSAQVGKKEEAISCYEKVISLTSPNSKISKYSSKGIICLQDAVKCHEPEEGMNSAFPGFSENAHNMYEKLKLENLQREMNRSDDVDPVKFKEYKDYSGMNEQPSNEEIVAALKTLEKAGLGNISQNYAMLNNSNGMNDYDMLNFMTNSKSVNPQIIQTLMTNSMQMGLE